MKAILSLDLDSFFLCVRANGKVDEIIRLPPLPEIDRGRGRKRRTKPIDIDNVSHGRQSDLLSRNLVSEKIESAFVEELLAS